MQIALSSPLTIAGHAVATIELRPPGRKVFDVMRVARGPVRFTEEAVVRFGARPSDHSEPTFRRLSAEDVALVAEAIEQLYARARRRYAARSALAETAKATARREADEE